MQICRMTGGRPWATTGVMDKNERLKKEAYYGYTIVLDSDIDMNGENWGLLA